MKSHLLAVAAFVLASAPLCFAAPIECANTPSSPINSGGTLYVQFSCSISYSATPSTIDLTPYLTQGGALLSDNVLSAGYVVIIDGDPNTISAGDTNEAALFDESLWKAVLFWPGDQNAGTGSDSLTVYWNGSFPLASDVQSFDDNLYGAGTDSEFFVQATYPVTTYAPGNSEYDVVLTPEPPAWEYMAIVCMVALGVKGRGVIERLRS